MVHALVRTYVPRELEMFGIEAMRTCKELPPEKGMQGYETEQGETVAGINTSLCVCVRARAYVCVLRCVCVTFLVTGTY